jgi:nucleotide-binding universal stress UspA family protein
MTSFRETQAIGVAVGFDPMAQELVRYSSELAKKLGKDLVLLHVVEPWLGPSMTWAMGAPGTLLGAAEAFDQTTRDLAVKRLEELASGAATGVTIKKVVATGPVTEVLAEEANRLNLGLMIAGARTEKKGVGPSGFSTALSLMGAAHCPVLVVGSLGLKDLTGGLNKLFLSDDMSAQSEEACRFAYDLAKGIGSAKVYHSHISGITKDSLKTALELSQSASHTPQVSLDAVETVFAEVEGALGKKLKERAAKFSQGVEPVVVVRSGQVQEELALAVADAKPDVLIFGRHKRVHTKPFFLGRMPFKAMLAMTTPVLVVPQRES